MLIEFERIARRTIYDKLVVYCKSHIMREAKSAAADGAWTFLTNHAHVLLCIAEGPETRMRDLAERVGITERAVQRIVEDLAAGGYLVVEREGRRNRYKVNEELRLRHPVEAHCAVSGLIALVHGKGANRGRKRPAEREREQR